MSTAIASFINGPLTLSAEMLHAMRVELAILLAFALFWFGARLDSVKARAILAIGGRRASPKTTGWSKGRARLPSVPACRPGALVSRCGAQNSSASLQPVSQADAYNPSSEQLRDPAWLCAAVQMLLRTHEPQHAFDLYNRARRSVTGLQKLSPSEGGHLFMALVTTAIRLNRVDEAHRFLRDCRRYGPGVTTALLTSATKLTTAHQFFQECLDIYDFAVEDKTLVLDDHALWSCLLFCAIEARAYKRCPYIWESLKSCGHPSYKDFGNMMRYASTQVNWHLGLSLIHEMQQAGFDIERVVYNTALAICVAASQIEQARRLLEQMEGVADLADVITYNTLAKGYAKNGQVDDCFDLFRRMRTHGLEPSQVTYGILLDCCVNESQVDRAQEVFDSMLEERCPMNRVLYTTMIKGFARMDQLDKAMKVFKHMLQDDSEDVSPDLITFSILIKANCDAARLKPALRLLEQMMELKLCPDEVIFNNLLGGCVRENNCALAKRLYNSMVEGGIRPSSATFSIFIRLYSSCKLLEQAIEMLRTEPAARGVQPEQRLYLQLAQSCLRERQGRRAVEVYQLMLQHLTPTLVVNSTLLSMCAKLNMVDTGSELLTLAAEVGSPVEAQDVAMLIDQAKRKKKDACVDACLAACQRLGIHAKV
mmetsp:Transcript_103517/g.259539  ORF Transcript_103517/g.259539 Transcript_103517/m.259539 type:complete len:652 (+) Transcript_103517:117-2072(+)